jgi:hypothetical protein
MVGVVAEDDHQHEGSIPDWAVRLRVGGVH